MTNRVGQFSQILLIRLYAAAASFLLTLLLGRLLGPSEFGAYVFAMGWVSIAVLFTTFGFHHFAIRAIPPLIVRDRMPEAMGVVVFATVAITLLALATTLFARMNLGLFATDPALHGAVAAATLLLLPRSWNLLRTGVLQGLGHPVAGQVPERLLEPTLLLIAIGTIYLAGWPVSVESVLYLTLAAMIASLFLGMAALVRALRRIVVRPAFGNCVEWVRGAFKSSLVFAAGTVLGATDVVMLGLLSTPEETGIYGVAARFFLLMGLPFHAAGVYLSRPAAVCYANSDKAGLQAIAAKSSSRTLVACIGLAVPSTIAAAFVEQIFGSGFAPASLAIVLLVWTRVALSVFGEPSAFLANTGHVGRVSMVMLFGAVLNIILNAILAGPFGAMGAAIATALSYSAMTLLMTRFLENFLEIKAFSASLLLQAIKGDRR
ncbi:polysaccharide biosynthesis C-terminal domain-containing protein [Sulfitobacter aestuariivivens]|uniref:Polysaccharide biosynthesis C-terminal domain-containing protein n=1 Tax=Sulfitobacter aestuariivivens TaxID=2766981 RepID=A0A927D922_9RHOB|nr:polysaccharide biosynthesis C-terminal domain-containing protein [Sulfitobacter aestuariivivens]MBD3665442.1 polysaccharide biosynthesis C-terminal domain-containing protein [Sulfitobacter aestuariivivens]